ncbi:hypothetical protein [Pontixanthobacter aquaemixtae]|uniref:Uncharacterized protein n=1 Tax=Pontixanthobacter aquaemixtae TaxID=1958940 RepID=A0A844ZVI2_9SPHN|nr:hypothetical protein [Pontixanthobacter aquaemixtae]MXO91180.1 hypothetical protein [Pontixanthobacter aquaemixtae]
MNKALENGRNARKAAVYGLDLRKSMSNQVAYALLVYTAINIFATVGAMHDVGLQTGALLGLCVLVAAIIPALRKFERRWTRLSDDEAADEARIPAYRRDLMFLWVLAIGLPVALTFVFKAIAVSV